MSDEATSTCALCGKPLRQQGWGPHMVRTHGLREAVLLRRLERATFLARPSVMLGVVPTLDGDHWCALYGPNLMEGVAGFGPTPDAAMAAFDAEWSSARAAKGTSAEEVA